jgi:Family of unknown function (DUF6188)
MTRKRQLERKGRLTVLPILGHTVSETRFRQHGPPILCFRGPDRDESVLEFESAHLVLRHGSDEHGLAWKSGQAFSPDALKPFVNLIGVTIRNAVANDQGGLCLEFSNGAELTATPDVWEGWHFRGIGCSLHGDDARLIVFNG